jgi:hypothetical protein
MKAERRSAPRAWKPKLGEVIYCSGLSDGSGITPQMTIGGVMADVLYFGFTRDTWA